jgi:hypothetical protein
LTSNSTGYLTSIDDIDVEEKPKDLKPNKPSAREKGQTKKIPAPVQPTINFLSKEKSAEKIVGIELLMAHLKETVRKRRVEFYFLCASLVG